MSSLDQIKSSKLGLSDHQRRLQLRKVKPHELLAPPKVDLQRELVVNTDKGTEMMEHRFNQRFERNLRAHRSNLREYGSGNESAAEIMHRPPVDKVNNKVMDIMYQIMYEEQQSGYNSLLDRPDHDKQQTRT